LDGYKEQINRYLGLGLNLSSIRLIINNQLARPITYNSFKYFVRHEEDLFSLWQARKTNIANNIAPKAINPTIQ